MKKFSDLNLGYYDAQNYLNKEHRHLLNSFFYKDETLNRLLDSSINFIIGEKGTGKTAYSVYLANNTHKNTKSVVKYINDTDYKRFYLLKSNNFINFSDYQTIWKTILLLLILKDINKLTLNNRFLEKQVLFKKINTMIDDYYQDAFSPEITQALTVLEETELRASLAIKNLAMNIGNTSNIVTNKTRFSSEILSMQKNFETAISGLKLNENLILFVDGIDIRPIDVPYKEYLECIKGLVEATWALNNGFLSSIKDSKGRIKIVLLLRPDIFNAVNLQNSANKIRDNAVILDWKTTYPVYRESKIFKLIDKLLSSQQENKELPVGAAWDYYFPWKSSASNIDREWDEAFIPFLRYSYSRPRDIIAALQILQEYNIKFPTNSLEEFFNSNEFKKEYSEFLLDSIKNQTAFYYSEEDYNTFITFFDFLHTPKFTWEEFQKFFEKYKSNTIIEAFPEFMSTDKDFLQFLYDSNIICYIEEFEFEPLYRWCYRERKTSKMSPRVKIGVKYAIHQGLWKSLSLGWQKKKDDI